MIVVDTTVLVYAVGEQHPLAEPSRSLVAAVGDGRVLATTTAEVIQEFVHVHSRRRSRSDAVRTGRDYAELLSPLVAVERSTLERGLSIFERIPKLGAFDAVLAATALEADADGLVSADAAFAEVPTTEVLRVGLAGAARVDRPGLDEDGNCVALGLEQGFAHVAEVLSIGLERQRDVAANLDAVEVVAGEHA